MNQLIPKLNIELNFILHAIDIEKTDLILKTQKSILSIKDALTQLRAFTLHKSTVSPLCFFIYDLYIILHYIESQ